MHMSLRTGKPAVSHRSAVWTFGATTFVASTLLFLVQPMFAKMVLPRLGGSPAVWSACVLFFQSVLLVGYLYAHLSVRWFGARRQAFMHLALMASAVLLLPLSLGSSEPPPDGSPVLWLLITLTLRLGLPFFALSTMAPLVQRWYSTLPVPSAANPYFLYAASNVGSMLALLVYPFVLEPMWGTRTQTWAWSAGYVVLLALTGVCAFVLRRESSEVAPPAHTPGDTISWPQRLRWTALAFVPSSLMLGVTTHISTDLASIPLLWVLPLAAYLLTFVIVFSARDRVPRTFIARALPPLVFVAFLSIAFQFHAPWLIAVHLGAFFAAALVCHDALARSRPPAEDLTTFYVWMSFGGMLGGVFNTLVAPVAFNGIFEYPIVLVLACFARPSPAYRKGMLEPTGLLTVAGVTVFAASIGMWATGRPTPDVTLTAVVIIAIALLMAMSTGLNRVAPFNTLCCVAVVGLMVTTSTRTTYGNVVYAGRSFFGVSRVVEATDHSYRLLQHGTTLHGRQNLPAGTVCQPQSYYDTAGPVGDLFLRSGRTFQDVAVVGLGSGGLSCYATAGSRWTFFEIDALVERIARNAALFTFVPNSAGQIGIVIGDGRKGIESAAPASYDVVVLDAFSSDAVPAHLLTAEAIDAYLSRIRTGGLVVLHISNRYLDLEPVIGRLASDRGLAALTNRNVDIPAADAARGRTASQWVVIARDASLLSQVRALPGWRPLAQKDGVYAWTDDYSNLLHTIRWK
jgi:hypothetical protein